MNTPVSFPLAKVLKEKGFKQDSYPCYGNDGEIHTVAYFVIKEKESYFAPTISDFIMWLYETHKIWISVYEYRDHAADSSDPFVFRSSVTGLKEFKTPTEAYSAAIEFVLNNRLTSQTK